MTGFRRATLALLLVTAVGLGLAGAASAARAHAGVGTRAHKASAHQSARAARAGKTLASLTVGIPGTPSVHRRGFGVFDLGPSRLGTANRSHGNAATLRRAPARVRAAGSAQLGASALGLSGARKIAPQSLRGWRLVPGLRTAYSNTYESSSGVYVAKVFDHQVNYRTAAGTWQPLATRGVDDAINSSSATGNAAGDCTIYSGAPNSDTNCASSTTYATVGSTPQGGVYETMINFPSDPGGIPADSEVIGAQLSFNVEAQNGPAVVLAYSVLPMTDSFSTAGAEANTASWNCADSFSSTSCSGTPWTCAGGDFAGCGTTTPTIAATGAITGTGRFNVPITALAQSWVDGSYGNGANPPAVMLYPATPPNPSTTPDTVSLYRNTTSSHPTYVLIYYVPRLGADPGSTVQSTQLNSSTSLGVNVANGDVQVTSNDLHVSGIAGLDLGLSHTYNSLTAQLCISGCSFSMGGWTADQPPSLAQAASDAVAVTGSDGNVSVWNSNSPVTPTGNSSGTYTPPPGVNGALCRLQLDLHPSSVTLSNGYQIIFYAGHDGLLHYTDNTTTAPFATGDTSIPISYIAPNTSPVAVVDNTGGAGQGLVHVFYVGTDGLLHEVLSSSTVGSSGSGGTAFQSTNYVMAVGAAPAPNTSPSVYIDSSNVIHVVYVNTSDTVSQVFGAATTTGGWSVQGLPSAAVATNSSPAAMWDGGQFVFYVDTSGAIHQLYWASTWSDSTLGGHVETNTSPSVAIGTSSDMHIAYLDTAGAISEWNTGTAPAVSWSNAEPLSVSILPTGPEPPAAPNSSPSISFDSYDDQHISWAGNTGLMWNWSTTGGPSGPATATEYDPTPPGGAVAQDTSALQTNNGVFYFGTNSHLFEWYASTTVTLVDTDIDSGEDAVVSIGDGCYPHNPAATFELTSYHSGQALDFNAYGQVIAQFTSYGNATQDELQYTYPSTTSLWPSSVTDTEGRTFSYQFALSGEFSGVNDNNITSSPRSFAFGLTGSGQVTSFTDLTGASTTQYGYSSTTGQLKSVTDANGDVTNITYPTPPTGAWQEIQIQRMTSATAGDSTTYTYYAGGGPAPSGSPAAGESCGTDQGTELAYGYTVIQEPDSGHWEMDCYDTHDRVYDVIDAYGQPTVTTYDADDDITGVISPTNLDENGATPSTSASYDTCFRLTSQSSGQGGADAPTTTYDYPGGAACSTQYDFEADQVFEPSGAAHPGSSPPNTDRVSYTYNPGNGELESEVDQLAKQNTASFTYNQYGQMATSTDADGQTTTYCYTTNSSNCATSYGNLLSVTPPSVLPPLAALGADQYTYDGDSRMLTAEDGNSNTTTYTYNKVDQVLTETDQSHQSVTNTYDADENLVKSVDTAAGGGAGGTSTYAYDEKNRLVFASQPAAGGQPGNSSSYTYDADDNLGSVFGGAKITPAQTTGALAGGNYFGVELGSNGSVYSWGYNNSGQLGNNGTVNSSTPVAVSGLPTSGTTVTALAAGNAHAVALEANGSVWDWGLNNSGQLGNNTTTNSSVPVQVTATSLTDATAISAATNHTMAIQSGSTVWGWGANTFGQLGNGSSTASSVPVQATGLTGVTGIAAGDFHSLAIEGTGSSATVWGWGLNNDGQLGLGNTTNQNTPQHITALDSKSVSAVAAGAYHSLAIAGTGSSATVYGWGDNNDGQVGVGTTTASYNTPQLISGLSGKNIIAVAAGDYDSFALSSNGTLYAWGQDASGQLGNGNTTNQTAPVQVGNVSTSPGGYAAIAAEMGSSNGLFATQDGVPVMVGDNTYGQLGSGLSVASVSTPVEVAGGEAQYTYNADDNPLTVQEPDASSAIQLTYDQDQRLICTGDPNGVTMQDLYDQYSNVIDIQGAQGSCNTTSATGTPTGTTPFSNYAYSYTYPGSTATSTQRQTETINGTKWGYYYDALNRLTQATSNSGTDIAYGYDGDGNMTSRVQTGGSPAIPQIYQAYDAADELCQQTTTTQAGCPTGTATYQYDADGNELNGPDLAQSLALTYNTRSQTTSMTAGGGSAQNLSYVGFGQDNLQQTGTAPTGGQAPVLESNTLGVSASEASTASGANVQITYYTRTPNGTLLSERLPTNTSDYYTEDANGSVVALTTSTGANAGTYTYDPYGQTTSSSTPTGFGFDGGYLLPSGLYHFGARYYDPNTGRWTQQDPDEDPTDLAQGGPYSFADGDPVNATDGGGEFAIPAGYAEYTSQTTTYCLGHPHGSMHPPAWDTALGWISCASYDAAWNYDEAPTATGKAFAACFMTVVPAPVIGVLAHILGKVDLSGISVASVQKAATEGAAEGLESAATKATIIGAGLACAGAAAEAFLR